MEEWRSTVDVPRKQQSLNKCFTLQFDFLEGLPRWGGAGHKWANDGQSPQLSKPGMNPFLDKGQQDTIRASFLGFLIFPNRQKSTGSP